jgi:hypothetical protein
MLLNACGHVHRLINHHSHVVHTKQHDGNSTSRQRGLKPQINIQAAAILLFMPMKTLK